MTPSTNWRVPVGFVREYHSWQWDNEGPDKQRRFQPSGAAGGNSWFFDDYYAQLKAHGVTVSPAIQQSSPAYFPGADMEAKPLAAGSDSEAPASYAIHAEHLFQYAARYGSTRVPDAQIQLAAKQPRSTGLGALRYIENWNEPDKTWRGRAGRFNPYELAAMCSADKDGDQGRMGKSVGVRNADPKMQLVFGGLAGMKLDYLRAMKFWADNHRNGDFPADVINLHYYSSDGDEQQAFKTTGISPEADHVREKLAAFVHWRDMNVVPLRDLGDGVRLRHQPEISPARSRHRLLQRRRGAGDLADPQLYGSGGRRSGSCCHVYVPRCQIGWRRRSSRPAAW